MSESSDPKRPPGNELSIKISDEVHRGVYATQILITHSRNEFVVDFIVEFPPGPQVVSRVILSPAHTAAFLDALGENLHRYEKSHGAIRRNPPTPGAPSA